MEFLFSETGFEQDYEPQVCLKGNNEEFEHFVTIIRATIKYNLQGEISLLSSLFDVKSDCTVTFYNVDGEKQLMKKSDENHFFVKISKEYWERIIELFQSIINNKGYQFIEFDDAELISDHTWICQSV